MIPAKEQFLPEIINYIKNEIKQNNYGEVVFLCSLNKEKIVYQVSVISRGNMDSAPALLKIEGPGKMIIHNHPSGNLLPSDNDISIASILANNIVGFGIIDNTVKNVNVVVEPQIKYEVEKLDYDKVIEVFSSKSSLSKIKEFKERESQKTMVKYVINSLNNNRISIIESGTGTGKTWAYLVPLMEWVDKNHERCVISTYTINLQQQILNDFFILNTALKSDKLKITAIKGRKNYLCKLRLDSLSNTFNFLLPEGVKPEDFEHIKEWSKKTLNGTKSDISFSLKDSLWEEISADGETCINDKCQYFPGDCFYFKAREKALSSDILIVNHHLLFTDIMLKSQDGEFSVLPEYSRIILDEAHHLEDSYRSQQERIFSWYGFVKIINKIYIKKGKKSKGLLTYFESVIPNELLTESINKIDEVRKTAKNFFETIFNEILSISIKNNYISLEDFLSKSSRNFEFKELINKFGKDLTDISSILKEIIEYSKNLGDDLNLKILYSKRLRILEYSSVLKDFIEKDEKLHLLHIDERKDYKSLTLRILPIDLSQSIVENVYTKFPSIVMTSATLSVDNRFDLFKRWIGLDKIPKRVDEVSLTSPFDYKNNMSIMVPSDFPLPTQEIVFLDMATNFLSEVIKIADGKTFILFTSYYMMEKFHKLLSESLSNSNFSLLKQGDYQREELLNLFKKGFKTVLLGTSSFWEGVDVVGDSLSVVAIMKLPFPVPTEPLFSAKSKIIEEEGGNSFMDLSVPLTSLKLKQGIGRLIRSENDKGIVLILDNRLTKKRYGKTISNSLQNTSIRSDYYQNLVVNIDNFIKSKKL